MIAPPHTATLPFQKLHADINRKFVLHLNCKSSISCSKSVHLPEGRIKFETRENYVTDFLPKMTLLYRISQLLIKLSSNSVFTILPRCSDIRMLFCRTCPPSGTCAYPWRPTTRNAWVPSQHTYSLEISSTFSKHFLEDVWSGNESLSCSQKCFLQFTNDRATENHLLMKDSFCLVPKPKLQSESV